MTIPMWLATFAWLCLVSGLFFTKKRGIHIRLMLTGIAVDFLLVLFLQLTRAAVQTALKFELSTFQQIHIGFSTSALALYPLVIYLGRRLFITPANSRIRNAHRNVAITCFILRTLGFLFMFSMLGRHQSTP